MTNEKSHRPPDDHYGTPDWRRGFQEAILRGGYPTAYDNAAYLQGFEEGILAKIEARSGGITKEDRE